MNIDEIFKTKPALLRVIRSIFNMDRQKFLNPNALQDVDSKQIGQATNIFLRYQLVDQLLDAVDYPSNPARVNFGRMDMTKSLPGHLRAVSSES
jgi:hypothetical protein